MVTKEQAVAARHGQTFHYTGRNQCTRTIGPRGGVAENITSVRVSGSCKTWKTRPADFRLPIKYGLYESWEIDQGNAADFHAADDCPVREGAA